MFGYVGECQDLTHSSFMFHCGPGRPGGVFLHHPRTHKTGHGAPSDLRFPRPWPAPNCPKNCCAQQTGMHIGCGSTAYPIGTIYEGKGHLYTPGVCPASLAAPCLASLATPHRFTGDHPTYPVDDAQLVTPYQGDTGTRPFFQQNP